MGALAIAGEGTIVEANRPQLVTIEIPLAGLAESWDGFRIVQLSDIHYDEHFSIVPLRKAIDMVAGLKPDLVVLTGDYVTAPWPRPRDWSAVWASTGIAPCAQWLAKLQAPFGILAILGNHDFSANPLHVAALFQSHGISVLRNHSVSLEREGKRLWFAGLDDVLSGKPDLDLALRGIPIGETIVLLAHEPDFADYVGRRPIALQLSGHSHGGQIRLPLIGPPYLPKLARKYPWGLRRIGPLTLYTNAGIGTIRVPVRLNCPPEVTLITLRAAPALSPRG
jgi:predicted MPP superfamily phosphohydrolase